MELILSPSNTQLSLDLDSINGRPTNNWTITEKNNSPIKFITHSFRAAHIACRNGWLPGARYSNLRDVRKFDRLGFLDIDWKRYDFRRHLEAAKSTRPFMTVARDIEDINAIDEILDQASELEEYAEHVIIVPKDCRLRNLIDVLIPERFILGFSVPTRYGSTTLPFHSFNRPVHLLGGRPDVQRKLAKLLNIFSFDCNRFTLDAEFGDYFDGRVFKPHPIGGYETCLEESIRKINDLWIGYSWAPRSFEYAQC